MKRTFTNLMDQPFEVNFRPHDISKYDVLFHVTLKKNVDSIKEKGLLIKQPMNKSLVQTDLLFFSYPIDMNTSDCFRWSDEHYALVILDAKKLQAAGVEFYDDYFGRKDASSKRNHIVSEVSIPAEFIKDIKTWK